MSMQIVTGNILNQPVDIIVNSWNRNYIPWWLLLPHGVAGAIRKNAGIAPFRELSKKGILVTGEAVLTSSGKLSYKGIIHVAGLNLFWVATKNSIVFSVKNACELAVKHQFESVAFPIIGSGVGGYQREEALELMQTAAQNYADKLEIIFVLYEK